MVSQSSRTQRLHTTVIPCAQSHFYDILKKAKLTRTEDRSVVARTRGGEKERYKGAQDSLSV